MIENIVTVKSATFQATKDGKKQYLSAVLVGEKGRENTQAIFDPKIQQTVQEALKNSLPLKVKLEKEGTFWNIKEAEITTEQPKKEERTQTSKQPYGKHSNKDSEVESSKRCALMQATDIYTHCTDSSVPFDDDYFKRIYKVCSSLISDSPLIEEAKKMGAVEK